MSALGTITTVCVEWSGAEIPMVSAFLIPLSYRRKTDWAEYGLVTAFFTSLFIEMYGIPLTIIFASKIFTTDATELPQQVLQIEFIGVGFGFTIAMVYGTLLMTIGAVLIIIAWITLYRNIKKEKIAKCNRQS